MKNNINAIIAGIIGFGIGMLVLCIFLGFSDTTLNALKASSIIFVGISLLFALFQYRNSNQWNKKQLATIRLHESEKNIKSAIAALHSSLDIINRDPDNPYEAYEIHNEMGIFLKDGKFIFHGEHKDCHIKQLPEDDEQQVNHKNEFDKDVKGSTVRDNIVALLNEYEYLALNVNCGIFDKDTVLKLIDIKIVRTYKKFEKYINHLRIDHKYGDTIYIELDILANEIMRNKNIK